LLVAQQTENNDAAAELTETMQQLYKISDSEIEYEQEEGEDAVTVHGLDVIFTNK
jgi:hypothetical protein